MGQFTCWVGTGVMVALDEHRVESHTTILLNATAASEAHIQYQLLGLWLWWDLHHQELALLKILTLFYPILYVFVCRKGTGPCTSWSALQ